MCSAIKTLVNLPLNHNVLNFNERKWKIVYINKKTDLKIKVVRIAKWPLIVFMVSGRLASIIKSPTLFGNVRINVLVLCWCAYVVSAMEMVSKHRCKCSAIEGSKTSVVVTSLESILYLIENFLGIEVNFRISQNRRKNWAFYLWFSSGNVRLHKCFWNNLIV